MKILALAVIVVFIVQLQEWIFRKYSYSGLEYKCEFSTVEAHEGDNIFLVETVYNRKILPVPWLKVDIHSSKWLDFAETRSVVTQENRRVTSSFVLRGYQKTTRRWRLNCLKRGVFTIENVTLITGGVLARNANSIPLRVGARLLVYPAIVDIDNMFVPVNYLQGDTIVRRWIIDDPFIIAGVREYTSCDPMSRIHWQATAKEGRLMVRKNDFTSQTSLTVIVNIQSKEYEYSEVIDKEMIELAIKVAATILDRSLRDGIPVRLATNGSTIDGNRQMILTGESAGIEHVRELLQILAKLELRNVRDFKDFFPLAARELKNTDVVIITSYIDDKILQESRELQKRMNAVRIILLDTAEGIGSVPEDIDLYVLSSKRTSIKAGDI